MKHGKALVSLLLALVLLGAFAAEAFAYDVPGSILDLYGPGSVDLDGSGFEPQRRMCEALVNVIYEEEKDNWDADCATGCFRDLDSDSYPELVMLYSTEGGRELEALVATRGENNTLAFLQLRLCALAGGAAATIYEGMMGKEPVIHVVYTNFEAPSTKVGLDVIFRYTNGKLAVRNLLEWWENSSTGRGEFYVDGVKDYNTFRELYKTRGKTLCSYMDDDATGFGGLMAIIADYRVQPSSKFAGLG